MPRLASRLLLLLVSAASVCLIVSCGSATISGGSGGGSGSGGITPPTTGHIAVADGGDNRIVIYNAPLSANESASIVIGQTSFTQGSPNQGNATPSSATLDNPWGLAMDATGNLWVADNQNCRVLEFQPPFTTGMNASLVIGEPNFDTLGPPSGPYCNPSSPLPPTYMGPPSSIAFDNQGDLWVVEASVGRVAEYVPPFSNGMAPTAVVGQTNLENSAPCNGAPMGNHGPILLPTAATLCEPTAIAFDSQGDLWVADTGNVRLLEFIPPLSTGMSASLEMIGQPPIAFEDNGTSCNDTSSNGFCDVNAITFDRSGDLWVASPDFQRVLEFIPPFANGMAASIVLGQPNFADIGPWHPGTAGEPAGLSFDSDGKLIISGNAISPDDTWSGKIVLYSPPFKSGMNPTAIVTGAEGCPPSSVTANTLCPNGVLAFQ